MKRKLFAITIATALILTLAAGAFASGRESPESAAKSPACMGERLCSEKIGNSEESWYFYDADAGDTAVLNFNNELYSPGGEYQVTVYDKSYVKKKISFKAETDNLDEYQRIFTVPESGGFYVKVESDDRVNCKEKNGYGEFSLYLTYDMQPAYIKDVIAKKGGFKVSYEKRAAADYYQIKYVKKSVYDKSGWENGKTVKAGGSCTAKTVTGLDEKTSYYVKVRSVKEDDGHKFYSSWTGRKSVTTK